MRGSLLGVGVWALVAPALAQQSGAPQFERPYWIEKPVIEAVGQAELEVSANRATFEARFAETDRTAADATNRATERARLAFQAVKAKARDSRVVTSVTTTPIYETYRDRDGNVLTYDTPDRIQSYAATATLNVTVLDVAKAGEARAAALAARPDENTPLSYRLEVTSEIQRRAYEAAVADAAARARATAQAAGTTLGPLLVAQEGQGPCLGQWYAAQPGLQTSYAFPAPAPAAMAAADVVATGRAKGREVTITQADIDRLNLPSDPTPERVQARACLVYAAGR